MTEKLVDEACYDTTDESAIVPTMLPDCEDTDESGYASDDAIDSTEGASNCTHHDNAIDTCDDVA